MTAPVPARRDERDELTEWLLEGDPAIRWQVLRDLLDRDAAEVEAERALVAVRGVGAELVARQGPDGRWAGALYSPKWTSTTYTLLFLARLGLVAEHPAARAGVDVLWEHARRFDGGLNLAKTVREPEVCITAMLVYLAHRFTADGRFSDDVRDSIEWLLGEQLPDGGWNCETVRTGSTHGSFHTTIIVLEALRQVERSTCAAAAVTRSLEVGREFFLDHQLFRSHRTGEEFDPTFRRFPFPPQWHFDVLRGLEHFAEVDAPRDDRLCPAVDVVRSAQRKNGTWPTYARYPGRYWFPPDPRGPSRWSTLRALRVLRWFDRP